MVTEKQAISGHYKKCWGSEGQPLKWEAGPIWQLPHCFEIRLFPPLANRAVWTYATCGMSQQPDAIPIELHLLSPVRASAHTELLTATAHYHMTGAYLDVGHTVNFGRPWLAGSKCDRGLISLPYLDGPRLEWLETNGRRIRFLWLIPITERELEFSKKEGLDALENRFEAAGFNYADPLRESVV